MYISALKEGVYICLWVDCGKVTLTLIHPQCFSMTVLKRNDWRFYVVQSLALLKAICTLLLEDTVGPPWSTHALEWLQICQRA